jgi:hypothetical protein
MSIADCSSWVSPGREHPTGWRAGFAGVKLAVAVGGRATEDLDAMME